MILKTRMKTLSILLPIALMAACAPIGHRNAIDSSANASRDMARSQIDAVAARNDTTSPVVRTHNKPFIASRSETLAYEASLPSAFTKVTMRFPYRRYNLSQIAEIITKETGLPVQISPDVFLSPKDLVGNATGIEEDRRAAMAASATAAVGSPAAGAGGSSVPASATTVPSGLPAWTTGANTKAAAPTDLALQSSLLAFSREMELDYTGTLAGLLDRVSTRMGLTWDFSGDSINVHRFVTKSFNIKTPVAEFDETSEIGNTGASASKEGSNYRTVFGLKSRSRQASLERLIEQVKSVLSSRGKAIDDSASMTIVVTDAKPNMEKAQRIIDEHNAIMGRQIRLQIRVVTFKTNDDRDRGLDINALYTRLVNTTGTVVTSLTSAGNLAPATAGLLGVSIADPSSRWNGSNAILKALDEMGTTDERINRTITTLNHKPAPIAVTRQFSYVAETSPGTSSSTGASTTTTSGVGLKQEKETVGFTMFVTPFVTDANKVSLDIKLNKRVLVRMDQASAGSGATLQTVQQPVIDGEAHHEYASVKPGETLMISGYELDTNQYDTRNTNGDWTALMGSSYTGTKKRETTILLVTPYLVDGV